MYSKMRDKMKFYLSHEPFLYFNHKFGMDIKAFVGSCFVLVFQKIFCNYLENEKVRSFFDILTINNDKNGRSFVSSIEAKNYPFYGVQFHPEKNSL